jgi:hypothetical protein
MVMTSLAQTVLPGVPLVESPLLYRSLDQLRLEPAEREIAIQLHTRGYAVLDFPDPEIEQRIDRIKTNLGPRFTADLADPEAIKLTGNTRVQDAWQFDADVKAIACNAGILNLLTKLYGRRAFPFQTLNFPVGTQQHVHSDAIHFSSLPQNFMCGVWLAMEDVSPDAGPLEYYPGSHRWPIASNAMVGRLGSEQPEVNAQAPFETMWRELIAAHDVAPETFCARKGQALIWAANLLHGGSVQHNHRLTRWSQVTHYYFEDCIYYTPAYSDEPLGLLDLRRIVNIATGAVEPNNLLGKIPEDRRVRPAPVRRSLAQRALRALRVGLRKS